MFVMSGSSAANKSEPVVLVVLLELLRNPNAMLWMSKIREAAGYTAEHSLNVCILC